MTADAGTFDRGRNRYPSRKGAWPVWSTPFVPVISEVTRTRRAASEHLRSHQVPDRQLEDTMLLLSELVTNAVHHGAEPLELRVDATDHRIRVEVDDASVEPPVLRPNDPRRLGGMGMRIVNDLADAWGSRPSSSGKTVWFEVALPAG
ncbi:ATP-binding protein [Aquihabitans daechungensis]|uniref:ATP-binding protein n=1 Tax=Aquihabitans daechungensis TaxID=1052257 RepID=UPI003BA025E5